MHFRKSNCTRQVSFSGHLLTGRRNSVSPPRHTPAGWAGKNGRPAVLKIPSPSPGTGQSIFLWGLPLCSLEYRIFVCSLCLRFLTDFHMSLLHSGRFGYVLYSPKALCFPKVPCAMFLLPRHFPLPGCQ